MQLILQIVNIHKSILVQGIRRKLEILHDFYLSFHNGRSSFTMKLYSTDSADCQHNVNSFPSKEVGEN